MAKEKLNYQEVYDLYRLCSVINYSSCLLVLLLCYNSNNAVLKKFLPLSVEQIDTMDKIYVCYL